MPINPDAIGAEGEPGEFSWTSKDSLLYALGVGAGVTDPTGFELGFTTENTNGIEQQALPTQVVVMGAGAGRGPDYGDFNPVMLVHGEQHIELHQPLTPAGTAVSTTKVVDIIDKTKAAIVMLENQVTDTAGNPWWSARMGLFIRGEGGWGREREKTPPANVAPDREPDQVVSYETRTDQALLYRLNGDRNPLHSDPSFAEAAGFPKPILHGLCTYGFTGRALLHAMCDSDPTRFTAMGGRFSSPVMPGETLDVKIWDDGDGTAIFETAVGDRAVFSNGGFSYS
ncbi:MAG: enoyl-CoA hydratase [Acidimicrobiales bacterium]|nr:enoyl-CoA hydratase [Acidimicrobiales bacterium]